MKIGELLTSLRKVHGFINVRVGGAAFSGENGEWLVGVRKESSIEVTRVEINAGEMVLKEEDLVWTEQEKI